MSTPDPKAQPTSAASAHHADPAEVQFLVVRAGRTCWDEAQRVQGRTDLPLTERGRADVIAALEAAKALAPDKLAFVYTGPDEASEETARLVADRFGGKVKVLDELIGWDFGLWHGLHEEELAARYARAWERWLEDPTAVTPPNGERASDVQTRVAAALHRIAYKAESKPVAAILRPLQSALLHCWLNDRPINDLWEVAYRVPTAFRVALDPETLQGRIIGAITKASV